MSETDEPREPADEWFERADENLRAAERMLAPSPLPRDAFFHAQQSVECALKGYLSSRSRPIERTHDLVALVRECAETDSEFLELGPPASGLTPGAVDARYPGTPFSVTPKDAAIAVQTASGMVRFVRLRVSRK